MRHILLWCVQAVLALVFVGASWAKLMGKPEMIALFSAVGAGQWFRYVTGSLELTGALLVMVPKTRRIGAGLLATVMLGALAAHLFILHVPPTTPGVLFLMSLFVVWGGRWLARPWATVWSPVDFRTADSTNRQTGLDRRPQPFTDAT